MIAGVNIPRNSEEEARKKATELGIKIEILDFDDPKEVVVSYPTINLTATEIFEIDDIFSKLMQE